ncbi:hypothetical protein O7631_17850 [Micromonospora sp. WMMD967]|uniref:hypothetical protein n=1 Tax=Micromonospora sp. WMMD967 TaxID=3016101 RepID=UPI002417329B|nr:hypothetical protein [Micromonospora sp. WMMD967]MDG4838387.1 hypothetical protein [Micromonospora sp. WMMD967]
MLAMPGLSVDCQNRLAGLADIDQFRLRSLYAGVIAAADAVVTSQRCQLTEGRFAVPTAKRLMPLLIPPLVSVIAPQLLASIGRQLSDGPVQEQVHLWPASLGRRIWQTQYSIH